MKWYKYSWIVLITLIAVVACKKEKEEPIPVAPPLVMTEADIQVSYTDHQGDGSRVRYGLYVCAVRTSEDEGVGRYGE